MHSDKQAINFMPAIGHWTDDLVVMQDGSLMAMYHVEGLAADLAGATSIVSARNRDNSLARSVSDPRLEWWDHFVRQDNQAMDRLGPSDNWFCHRFDTAYQAVQDRTPFYRNDLFITVIMHRQSGLRTGLGALFGSRVTDHPDVADEFVQDFTAILDKIQGGVARYGARRLGIADRDGVVFSEIAEAQHLIANGHYRPLGLTTGRLGALVVPERVEFGHRDLHIAGEGRANLAAVLGFRDYPARTTPMMFAKLRELPFPLTMTNATRFRQKALTLKQIEGQRKRMRAGNDAAETQVQELKDDEDAVMSGRSVYVSHGFSLLVRAPTLEALDRRVGQTQAVLSDAGITGVRESSAIKPAYFFNIPGNMKWSPRPGLIKSINAVSLAAKHNTPRGEQFGRWGDAAVVLRTTADTQYAFHWHVGDVGSTLIFGPTSSGKTVLLGSVALLTLRNPQARVVVIDKDFGLSIMVRAAGGSYLVARSGEDSGIAPLRALHATPADRSFLERLVKGLIISDGRGEMSSDEDERLGRAVARQMEMPAELRGMAGIAIMLGQRSKDGAAARLRKWCRGERLGWAFDGLRDELDLSGRITGVDTTALFADPMISSPTLAYLFYRISALLNGQPLLLVVDEFWRADANPAFAEQIRDSLKTIRKREGVVALATQNTADALNSGNAEDLKQQVPTKIFFGDDSADRNNLITGFGLTEAEYLAVTQELPNMKHAFLIRRPGRSVICRFDLSGMLDKVAVISGREATYHLMNELIAQHGPDPAAWVPHFERIAPGVVDKPSSAARAKLVLAA